MASWAVKGGWDRDDPVEARSSHGSSTLTVPTHPLSVNAGSEFARDEPPPSYGCEHDFGNGGSTAQVATPRGLRDETTVRA
jgi:hypothetical protein